MSEFILLVAVLLLLFGMWRFQSKEIERLNFDNERLQRDNFGLKEALYHKQNEAQRPASEVRE
jgi:hypothetical protein